MSKIKVIHCVDNMGRGGLEQVVMMLAQGLDRTKFSVEVWCMSWKGEVADQLAREGTIIRLLNIHSYHNPLNILKLAALFFKHKPDIIHSHIYFTNTMSRIAAKLAGVPVVIIHMHNVYLHFTKRNLWIDCLLSHVSDRIICCSQAVQDFVVGLEKIDAAKTMIIRNGIDIRRFDAAFDAAALKRSLGIEEGDFIIIMVASLMAKKGHRYLFEALAKLLKDRPRIKCLLVGYGTSQEEEQARGHAREFNLDSCVQFLGLREDVPDLLRISDLFVLSSLTEGLPLCVIEAMAVGRAVVATDVGGVKEVVENGVTGLLVESKNSEALYAAIKKIIDDPALAGELARQARIVSRREFSSQQMVQKVEQVYFDLTSARLPATMKGMDQLNKAAYEMTSVVHAYALDKELQPPERTILGILKDRLPAMRMLDIGVGAGRTAVPFGAHAKEYVGVDYSENMIKTCRRDIGQDNAKMSFMACDARSMEMFEDNTFDFILFSYNGIDYMPHADRARALREIRRVGKSGGLLCFSTHNILCIEKYLRPAFCLNPLRLVRIMQRHGQVKGLIRSHQGLSHVPYGVIRDGGEEFRLETHYINPLEQIRALEAMRFKDVRVFSGKTGDEIIGHSVLAGSKEDRWLYFLGTIDKIGSPDFVVQEKRRFIDANRSLKT